MAKLVYKNIEEEYKQDGPPLEDILFDIIKVKITEYYINSLEKEEGGVA